MQFHHGGTGSSAENTNPQIGQPRRCPYFLGEVAAKNRDTNRLPQTDKNAESKTGQNKTEQYYGSKGTKRNRDISREIITTIDTTKNRRHLAMPPVFTCDTDRYWFS